MTRNTYCLVIAAMLIFSACTTSSLSPEDPLAANIDFNDVRFVDLANIPENLEHEEAEAKEFGLWLDIKGIYAIDQNTVFLFGAIGPPCCYGRSLLLRSTNGGLDWEEVLPPLLGNSVFHVVFLEDGLGWALSPWVVEDIGRLTLYQTEDYGETWNQLSEIPNDRRYPYGMEFSDKMNGNLYVTYIIGSPTDRYATLTTSDGGLSWEETDSIPLVWEWDRSEDKSESREVFARDVYDLLEPPGSAMGRHWLPCDGYCEATGHDGSLWRTEENQESDQLAVYRQLGIEDGWQTVSILPTHFGYFNGHVDDPIHGDD